MNKLFFLLTIVLLSLTGFSQDDSDTFFHQDWNAALSKAKETNKILLVDYYTDWCGWCKVMDNKTFGDSTVKEFLDKNFVVLKMNAEKDFGIDLAMKYRVLMFPSILFYNPDGNLIKKSLGYQDAKKFMETLSNIIDLNKESKYYKGINTDIKLNFPEFYRLAFGANGKKQFPSDETVNEFLNSQDDLLQEVCFSIIFRFNTDSTINKFFFDNYNKYIDLYGQEDVEYKLNSIISPLFKYACVNRDTVKLNQVLDIVEKYSFGDKAHNLWWISNNYLKNTEQWLELSESVLAALNKDKVENYTLNDYAWTIYEKSEDQTAIKNAISWMKNVVNKEPTYMYLDTYAALLYKDKQYNKAEEWAIKAIEKGKKEKTNVKATEDLLQKIKTEKQ